MKIIVSGKGGSGKSTVSSLLALDLVRRERRVLVVDADESNFGLEALLGLDGSGELMDCLGGKAAVGGKLRESMAKKTELSFFDREWGFEDIPSDCLSARGPLMLMQVGKIKTFGEGCACPIGSLAKGFLKNLRLERDDVAIVDAEAGVEHLGRGIAGGADMILAVLDPSYESIRLSAKMCEMAGEAGKPIYYVLNKVDGGSAEHMRKAIGEDRVIASIERNGTVERQGLTGEPLDADVDGITDLASFILGKAGAS